MRRYAIVDVGNGECVVLSEDGKKPQYKYVQRVGSKIAAYQMILKMEGIKVSVWDAGHLLRTMLAYDERLRVYPINEER